MTNLLAFLVLVFFSVTTTGFAEEINVNYELMNEKAFNEIIVGNTVTGITKQSNSLYMLHFLPEGVCELWKQGTVYAGKWWADTDALGRCVVHAFWPEYTSSEPGSRFSPENASYGKATAVRYYYDSVHETFLIAGNGFQTSFILLPERAFPR